MDIVERLRNRMTVDFDAEGEIQDVPDKEVIEAADEIERLRDVLKKIVDFDRQSRTDGKLGMIEGPWAAFARAALKEGE